MVRLQLVDLLPKDLDPYLFAQKLYGLQLGGSSDRSRVFSASREYSVLRQPLAQTEPDRISHPFHFGGRHFLGEDGSLRGIPFWRCWSLDVPQDLCHQEPKRSVGNMGRIRTVRSRWLRQSSIRSGHCGILRFRRVGYEWLLFEQSSLDFFSHLQSVQNRVSLVGLVQTLTQEIQVFGGDYCRKNGTVIESTVAVTRSLFQWSSNLSISDLTFKSCKSNVSLHAPPKSNNSTMRNIPEFIVGMATLRQQHVFPWDTAGSLSISEKAIVNQSNQSGPKLEERRKIRRIFCDSAIIPPKTTMHELPTSWKKRLLGKVASRRE